MLIEEMKAKQGEIGKTEMSLFATQLHDGIDVEVLTDERLGIKKKTKILNIEGR
jgi:hypothetical protein